MREIKFRAFDVSKKQMINEGCYQFEQFGNNGLRPNIDKQLVFPFEGIESGEMVTGNALNGFHIMQYTGLKDKNGKEIYEGDILSRRGVTSFVVWTLDSWRFNSYMVGGMDLYPHVDRTRGSEHEIAEVIGNIYETPELLK